MTYDLSGVVFAIAAVITGAILFFKGRFLPPAPPVVEPPPPEPLPAVVPPVVYGFFSTVSSPYEWMEKVALYMTYRLSGCGGSGEPTRAYGAHSPSGRPLTYEWHLYRASEAEEDSVFDAHGVRINGVPVASEVAVWFNGWQKEKPPYPFYVYEPEVDPQSCRPVPPIVDIDPQKTAASVRFLCIVRDDRGGETEFRTEQQAYTHNCGK